MATDKNFVIKNGLTINGSEIITSSGNLTLAEYLYHSGDVDTNLRFQTDRATLTSGGGASVDAHNNGNLYLTGTTVQVYGNYNSTGTISSGTITSTSSTDGATIRISSTQNDSVHSTTVPFGILEFYSSDGSGPGAGVRGSIKSFPASTTGGAADLVFSTANSSTHDVERMRITDAGNVGIGVTDPDTPLHVLTNTSGYAITIEENSGNEAFQIGVDSIGSLDFFNTKAATSHLSLVDNGDTIISGGGNVGIGTTSIDEKLHVQGSVNNDDIAIKIENTYDDNLSTSRPAAALLFATTSNNAHLRVFGAPADTAANHQIDLGSTANGSFITFSPQSTEAMRIAQTVVDVNVFLDLNDNYITGVNSYRNVNDTEIIDSNNTSYTILKSYAGASRLWLGETATYLNNNNFYFRDTGSNHLVTINSTGLDIRSGGLDINSLEVIDSSRNLTNIGTISSGQLNVNSSTTNTTAVFESTDDKAFIRIKDDDTDTYLISKDGNFSIGGSSEDYDNFKVNISNGNTVIDGTISSGAINTTGAITIDVDNQADGALRIEANQTNPDNDYYFAQEIISTLSGTTATTGDREQGGIYMDINSTATGGDTSNEHRAYGMIIDLDSTGDADLVYGVYSNATATPTTGTTTNVYGGYFHAEDNGGAGSVTTVIGIQGTAVSDNATSDVNAMYGGYFKNYNQADSAAIGSSTAVYGEIEIPDGTADIYGSSYVFQAQYDNNGTVSQTNSTYLFYGNYAGVLPTNAYGVYIADAVDNYFAGTIDSGAITSSGEITTTGINIGTDSGDSFNSQSVIKIQDGGNAYMQIKAGTSSVGGVLIGDVDDDYVGGMLYSNSTNALTFNSGNVLALTLDSSQNATFAGTIDSGAITSTGLVTSVGGVVNTNTGSNAFYVTRSGATNQALKIYVDDASAIFESIQDESLDNYGTFIFAMDGGTTEPFFDVRKGTSSSGSKFRVDGSGALQVGSNNTTFLDASRNLTNIGTISADSTSETNTVTIDGTGSFTLRSYHDSGGVGWATGSGASYNNLLYLDDSNDFVRIYSGQQERARFNSSGIDARSGGFRINGLTVIDSDRNLDNINSIDVTSTTSGLNKFTFTDTVSNAAFTGLTIDYNASGSQAHTADNTHRALFVDVDTSQTGGNTTDENRTYGIHVDVRGAGDTDLRYGVYSYSETQHSSGTVSSNIGVYGIGIADDTGTGHTTNNIGVQGFAYGYNSGTGGTTNHYAGQFKTLLSTVNDKNTSTAHGVYAEVEIDNPGQAQTVTNTYGVRSIIDNDSAGNVTMTNAYLFHGDYQGTIPSGGYGLYIGDNVPNYVGGEIRSADNITAYYSDERLKDFHGKIDNPIDKVKQLNGYYFTENKKAKKLGYNNDKQQVGVNAQEVQKVLPEIVDIAPISHKEDVNEEYLTVHYDKLVPLLIEAVKEQQKQIEELKEEVSSLTPKN